jgi:hypothetical protein
MSFVHSADRLTSVRLPVVSARSPPIAEDPPLAKAIQTTINTSHNFLSPGADFEALPPSDHEEDEARPPSEEDEALPPSEEDEAEARTADTVMVQPP